MENRDLRKIFHNTQEEDSKSTAMEMMS